MVGESDLLKAICDPRSTRDAIVPLYAKGILALPGDCFGTINKAIWERWSLYALEYIKHKAWKLVAEAERARGEG